MWTQRDQLEAYKFLRRRLVSAVQTGDANHPVSPSRRLVRSSLAGVLGVVLISAGFAVTGLLRPGANASWQKAGQVVVERESGAAYVLGADGVLHPALNYVSARLAAGGSPATVTVSARSLASAPRGRPVGIPGAPAALPSTLLRAQWTVCAVPGTPPSTVAILGPAPQGVSNKQLLVVRDDAGQRYALAGGHRLKVRTQGALVAIGADALNAVPVPDSFLDALPVGPDLALIQVAQAGQPGTTVAGQPTQIGEVLVVSGVGGADRYYVVQSNGLAPASSTVAALVLASPTSKATPQAVRVTAADIAAAPVSTTHLPSYPDPLPRPASIDPGGSLCLIGDDVRVVAGSPLPAGAHPVSVPSPGSRTADQIFVPPGHGALVAERPAPGAPAGTVYLLTDQGTAFPLGGADAVKALGFSATKPVPLDSALLALFPRGPLLDVASARQVVQP